MRLQDVYITAAVRCAPPDNKPTPDEIHSCLPHLDAELEALPRVRVIVALGKIAFDAYLQLIARLGPSLRLRPRFGHGACHVLPDQRILIGCYHPSRQNTQTKKLTPAMMDDIFRAAGDVIAGRVDEAQATPKAESHRKLMPASPRRADQDAGPDHGEPADREPK